MPNNRPRKRALRRNYFSQPKRQLRLMVMVLVAVVGFVGLDVYLGLSLLRDFRVSAQSLEIGTQALVDMDIIWERQRSVYLIERLFYGLGLFLVLGVFMLLLSHRIMGPIGRLQRYLNGVVDGTQKPGRLGFRQGDFFTDFPAVFNRFQKHCGLDVDGKIEENSGEEPGTKPGE